MGELKMTGSRPLDETPSQNSSRSTPVTSKYALITCRSPLPVSEYPYTRRSELEGQLQFTEGVSKIQRNFYGGNLKRVFRYVLTRFKLPLKVTVRLLMKFRSPSGEVLLVNYSCRSN